MSDLVHFIDGYYTINRLLGGLCGIGLTPVDAVTLEPPAEVARRKVQPGKGADAHDKLVLARQSPILFDRPLQERLETKVAIQIDGVSPFKVLQDHAHHALKLGLQELLVPHGGTSILRTLDQLVEPDGLLPQYPRRMRLGLPNRMLEVDNLVLQDLPVGIHLQFFAHEPELLSSQIQSLINRNGRNCTISYAWTASGFHGRGAAKYRSAAKRLQDLLRSCSSDE